ncbi:tail fiber domain-containing protein [Fodinibius salsisoli]|uniref:Tail fiber domain-containing protein n=1 Tax=Fodinibius salsisoli TaxID=2820877 RepID=A0ABT3PK33_9BACT|nr:tail fiber domain-containing protein [Fodinibius salsisoli]MCW9706123.1 tail fiber domain-containing protein [Fodinibius salsisoli]
MKKLKQYISTEASTYSNSYVSAIPLFISVLMFLSASLLIFPEDSDAQTTPLKVFVNADGDTVFVLNEGGGLNAGKLGNLDGQGATSVALGAFPTATGENAVAIGVVSQAIGQNAVALGAAKAQGDLSAALGSGPEALGEGSIALGRRTDAIGKYATSMGFETRAVGEIATAMGDRSTAGGDHSIASGLRASAIGPEAVSLGHITTAKGGQSVAMGFKTEATGIRSVALGGHTHATADYSIATGRMAEATAPEAISMGHLTKANGGQSVAMGFKTTATGTRSVALGDHTTAATKHSLSIGTFNQANTSADNTLFVAGNGSGGPDALVLDYSGDMTIAGSVTENSDRRLKSNIKPLEANVLEKLEHINPVRYRFKDRLNHSEDVQIGLLAQEVQEQFPELVNRGEGDYLGISYTKFTAVLLKGLQEQQTKIENFQTKLAHVNQLKTRIAKLEKRNQQQQWLANKSSISASGILVLLLLVGGMVMLTRLFKEVNNY